MLKGKSCAWQEQTPSAGDPCALESSGKWVASAPSALLSVAFSLAQSFCGKHVLAPKLGDNPHIGICKSRMKEKE